MHLIRKPIQTLFRLSRLAGAVGCGIAARLLQAEAPAAIRPTATMDAIYPAAFGAMH